QCGFKVVSGKVIKKILPLVKSNGWFFDTELLLLSEKNGYSVCEIPVRWTDDSDTRVKIFDTAWEDIKGLIRIRFGGLARARKILSRK
ncbi:MAG: glycosyltransferase family 2 protein, partial [SAR202 cluster bacterium]|nr:glycosyltransferase family 2 protein [SAR202 cluster bacterium]